MDPRHKALIEVRELLKSEGWAPDASGAAPPVDLPVPRVILRPNPILAILCAAAIATNFILIGSNHDLRAARLATLSVERVRLFIGRAERQIDPSTSPIFVTIDGDWVWGAEPRVGLGRGRLREKANDLPRIEIEGRNILQVWEKGDGGRAILIGQAAVSTDHFDGTIFEVRVDPLGLDGQAASVYEGKDNHPTTAFSLILVSLKIDKGRSLTDSSLGLRTGN